VERILARLDNRPPLPRARCVLRALEVLERIGSDAARHLLRELAGGAPGAWRAEEAKAAQRGWRLGLDAHRPFRRYGVFFERIALKA
jgi:hypothetical protein